MSRWTLPVLMVGSMCACSNMPAPSNIPARIESRPPAMQVSQSPERFIIVAVDIDAAAISAYAGSIGGYDTIAAYEAISRARQVMRSLEGEYGLHEVSAWPIEPLDMHCVVLEIPAGADRMILLTKLSRDPRISLAQPLQTFATRTED
jgi:hypothetical protein